MHRTLAIAAALALAAAVPGTAPAQTPEEGGVGIESILDSDVGKFLGRGFREEDRLLETDEYRETRPDPAYDRGELFPPDYGGDTHRARAGKRGDILNIFNLND